MPIKIQVCADAQEVARIAAGKLIEQVRDKPETVLGLATGSTPEQTYFEITRLAEGEDVSFRRVSSYNMDEYRGLAGSHPQSYRYYMQEKLFKHLDIKPENTHLLDGRAKDCAAECAAFEARIRAGGGIDLWLLGIGTNGHIAFNEPGSSFECRTRLVDLSKETIAANSDGRFFKDPAEVPRQALTVGIATIFDARKIVLLATGEKKAAAIAAAVEGPRTQDLPASRLQEHPDCLFLLDPAAASKLTRRA